MKAYLTRWRELGPILERLRDEELRSVDTPAAIQSFNLAFRIALRDVPPRETSGLVEWQRRTARGRKHG